MISKYIKKLLFTTSFVFFAFYFSSDLVQAQDALPLMVAPARQYLTSDPGEKIYGQIKFFNNSQHPVYGEIKIVDFIVNNSSGAPILLEDQNFSSRFSAASWTESNISNAVVAKESVLSVPFIIDIPKDARPGGRYMAILFEASGNPDYNQSDNQGISSVKPRVVGLVSLKINGQINENAFVDVFRIPSFLQFGPIPIDLEIFNNGDYHITPSGKVVLKNWFNKTVDTKDLEEKNIFPDAKRIYDLEMGDTWMFGKYTIYMTASYGEQGKVLKTESSVWILPIILIATVVLGIVIIILLSLLIINVIKKRQYNLEKKLEKEITEIESLKNRFKDQLPKR